MELNANLARETSLETEKRRRPLTVDGKTLSEVYLRRVQVSADRPAFLAKKDGQYQPQYWRDVRENVAKIAKFLRERGLKKGDRVGLLSETRPEWAVTDLAILVQGFVTVPVYHSSSDEDLRYIVGNSEMRILFVENPRAAERVRKALGKKAPEIILFDRKKDTSDANLEHILQTTQADEEAFHAIAKTVSPDDIASIIYTSGTTGTPKGAVLTHHNFISGLRDVIEYLGFTEEDTSLAFLPFAHVLGRVESLAPIICGMTTAYAENMVTIAKNIQEVRPTVLVSVPRIYEKIYSKIRSGIENEPAFKKGLFEWALEIGKEVAERRSEKLPIPLRLELKYRVANQLVLNKIHQKLGGRIRLTASGGAPISPELCRFFHACGVKVLEGYGLTETLGPICVNHPEDYRFGTVGKPMYTAEVKIADDGEILLRGAVVFRGYHQNSEATEEVFTPDGWFRSGDVGIIDDRGFLHITDRKKELIVTSGGKNIAPQKIENLLKLSRFITNAMVYGDKQKFITALITLNIEEIESWAKGLQLELNPNEAATHPEVYKLISQELSRVNQELASYESVKKFRILPKDFTVEDGELTPSLKLKRKVIFEKYKDLILAMYN